MQVTVLSPGDKQNAESLEVRTMTTANEIADQPAIEHELAKPQARAVVESVFKAIASAAAAGEEVSIPGFGKFKVKDSPGGWAATPLPATPSRLPRPRS